MALPLLPALGFIGGALLSFLKSYAFRIIIYKTLLTGAILVLLPRVVSWFLSSSGVSLINYFITQVSPDFAMFFQDSFFAEVVGLGAWFGSHLQLDACVSVLLSAYLSAFSIRITKKFMNFITTAGFRYTQIPLPGMGS
ncbi:MAG: hypothetical protein AB7S75_07760 [Desulfococcaceae bacterium]